ncbi:MAG: hypothetical protein EOP47_07625 [Sphingobacteriaceae bacterium]|nr:MAG: hypothetical protein EOP47_07625 [Sphingobacteriaceae bacterium]
MKKYLFIIASFMTWVFSSNVIAQTLGGWSSETKRLMHDMQGDPNDRWSYSGNSNTSQKSATDFKVWVKIHSIKDAPPFFGYTYYNNYTAKGDSLGAELYNIASLELAITSITPGNANNYQYKIIENDRTELVPWTTPSVFKSNKFTTYAYLGKFDCRRKSITLIIAEKNGKENYSVYRYSSDDKPAVKLRSFLIEYPTGMSAKGPSQLAKGLTILGADNPRSIRLEIEHTGENGLYHVYLKRENDGKIDTMSVGNGWEQVYLRYNPAMYIDGSLFKEPGKYTLIIRPEMAALHNMPRVVIGSEFKVNFTVAPGPTTVPLRTVIFIILVILSIAIRAYFYFRRKTKIAAQAKEIAVLQLQSVRSQLNPHFIFNALAGIQNLMNKNEVENANKYLARFARLTRNVLDDGQKELTPIAQEVKLLTDYLEMEQMRFGFKFDVNISEGVDQQIEIPAMLLQPFAENAVKHGISALKDEGLITIGINQTGNDITLKVTDNGGGFSKGTTTGMGIKLCEERIRLLNTVYKNTTILLHINPTDKGTTVNIELKNWL